MGKRRPSGARAQNLRRLLFEAQQGVCPPCQGPLDFSQAPNTRLYPTLDHVVPFCEGGGSGLDNLLLVHAACNARRGCRPATQFERGWSRRVMRRLGLDDPQPDGPVIYRFLDLRTGQFVP